MSAGSDSEGDTLSQTFDTSPNKVYTLHFTPGILACQTMARSNVMSQGDRRQHNHQSNNTPQLGEFRFQPDSVPALSADFHRQQRYTTLQFTDVGTGNATADVMVDTVSVAPEATKLVNGNFETPPFDMLVVTGWMIGGTGRLEEKMEGATTPVTRPLSAQAAATKTTRVQAFPTIIGRQYAVDFDAGIFGKRTGPRLQMQIQVWVPARS